MAVWWIAVKDWRRFIRQPFFMAVSILIPLAFVLFYSLIVPSSQTNPVVVAVEDRSPAASRFLETLRKVESEEAPWFEVVTDDSEEARRLFDSGDAIGLVVIPEGFGDAVAQGRGVVELHVHNINSDYSKNLALRVDHTVRVFEDRISEPVIVVEETTRFAGTLTMGTYISTSILLFAAVYAGLVNTGLAVASEWSDRTAKNLLLSPRPRAVLVAGKVLAGLGQSLVSVLAVAAVVVVVFGFRPQGSVFAIAGLALVMTILGAGLGAIIGVAVRKTLAVVSIGIPTALGIYFLSGFEDSLRGLAWDGPVAVLWQTSRFLPTTGVFSVTRQLALGESALHLTGELLPAFVLIPVVLGVAAFMLRRAFQSLPGGQ
ncbi:MAG TPA: ABC transporter permease [Acidimicrobiia bacterium]|nr:ABC transporter permease [Acidimicrobiia bacterium]